MHLFALTLTAASFTGLASAHPIQDKAANALHKRFNCPGIESLKVPSKLDSDTQDWGVWLGLAVSSSSSSSSSGNSRGRSGTATPSRNRDQDGRSSSNLRNGFRGSLMNISSKWSGKSVSVRNIANANLENVCAYQLAANAATILKTGHDENTVLYAYTTGDDAGADRSGLELVGRVSSAENRFAGRWQDPRGRFWILTTAQDLSDYVQIQNVPFIVQYLARIQQADDAALPKLNSLCLNWVQMVHKLFLTTLENYAAAGLIPKTVDVSQIMIDKLAREIVISPWTVENTHLGTNVDKKLPKQLSAFFAREIAKAFNAKEICRLAPGSQFDANSFLRVANWDTMEEYLQTPKGYTPMNIRISGEAELEMPQMTTLRKSQISSSMDAFDTENPLRVSANFNFDESAFSPSINGKLTFDLKGIDLNDPLGDYE